MSERKTDGGKGDRIPGADPAAYERGFAGINWHAREEEAERNRIAEVVAQPLGEGITVFGAHRRHAVKQVSDAITCWTENSGE